MTRLNCNKYFRSRLLFAVLITIVLLACAALVSCKKSEIPTLDYMPPGELLVSQKDLLPQNLKLRPINPDGISLTKSSERWVPHLYNDAVRYCTIGYGHLIKKVPCDGTEPADFRNGITEPRGEEILVEDLGSSQYTVMTSVKISLNDGQFAALTDFVFNVGGGNFRSSTLLKVLNANQPDQVPPQLRRWILAKGKPLVALQTRREQEIDLFSAGLPKARELPPPNENLAPIDVQEGETN